MIKPVPIDQRQSRTRTRTRPLPQWRCLTGEVGGCVRNVFDSKQRGRDAPRKAEVGVLVPGKGGLGTGEVGTDTDWWAEEDQA